jgi:hypothetical protein
MDGKVIRRTWPTVSYSVRVDQKEWVKAEAERRQISQSIFIRTLIDKAMEAQEKEAA